MSESDKRTFPIPPELHGRPLDGALKTLAGVTWGAARGLVESGKIKIGGVVISSTTRVVRRGETLEIDPRAPRPGRTGRLDKSVIVYVDPHVVVVNKPAGISTVPYDEKERGTLDQEVARLLPRSVAKGPPSSLGVVQRLDKETSGLLVFARTLAAKKILGAQLRAHTVHRRYLALAHGRVERGVHKSYLVENRGDKMRGTSRFGREGQLAITHVEPVEVLPGATLVGCRLETGRTHQIRIHLAESGHPILGERVYVRDFEGEQLDAPRPMLHAAELGFVHPMKGSPVKFEIPPPADFQQVLERLRGQR